jgi:prolyl 4-hydroxylase
MKPLSRASQGEVYWCDHFLDGQVCARIMEELEYCFWSPSTVVSRNLDGALYNHQSRSRRSESTCETWFSASLRRETGRIGRRLSRQLVQPLDCFEPWQVTRYGVGETFGYHCDGGLWADDAAGERRTTIILYVQAPRSGGATRFRELGFEVAPATGRLLVFHNLLPDGSCNRQMIHSSLPVRRGRKVTLVTWIRERAVRAAKQSKQGA